MKYVDSNIDAMMFRATQFCGKMLRICHEEKYRIKPEALEAVKDVFTKVDTIFVI
jgi:hypothetical protein